MTEEFIHNPVLGREVVELLTEVPAGTVVDATAGGGGHAGLLLAARPDIQILGIDRDEVAVQAAREALAPFGQRAQIVHGGFERITEIVKTEIAEREIVGVLFDLGVSSPQLDRADRGFSYWADAPLDMRMDSQQELTAATVVNTYDEVELAEVISTNGEERFASRIAGEIVKRRPLRTTGDLVEAIKAAIPAPARRRGGHPARRSFQAIRMEVNRELPNLEAGLGESVHLVSISGRILVLAYHSLEDRIVKKRFAEWSGSSPTRAYVRKGLPAPDAPTASVRLLTRRPLRASEAEVTRNPRSQSVRLRCVERIA